MRTGLLLPKSTTHPLLAHDLFAALKAALPEGHSLEFSTANIGFGTDKDLLYAESEKLWLEQQVDLLVVVADFPTVEVLFPLAASLNKLLLVVNTGAKYPLTWEAPRSVLFLNLQEWLNSHLTGALAAKQGSKGIFATSFYDGGYSASHSMSEGYASAGGEIHYNFVGKHLLKEFDAGPLLEFLKEQVPSSEELKESHDPSEELKGPKTSSEELKEPGSLSDEMREAGNQSEKLKEETLPEILCQLSGDLVPAFLEQLLQDNSMKPNLWANPAFLYELPALKQKYPLPLRGHVSWWASLDTEENQKFKKSFSAASGRPASPFALLGWETALLLLEIEKEGLTSKADEILQHLSSNPIKSPRGLLQLDPETHSFLGPAYLLQLEGEETTIQNLQNDLLRSAWQAFREAVPQPPQTGWINTYLCS